MMRSSLCVATLVLLVAMAAPAWTQQTFTGKLSDSSCGASHAAKAGPERLTDRQCLLACIKKLPKYVLAQPDGRLMTIANQDAMGLPLYVGRGSCISAT